MLIHFSSRLAEYKIEMRRTQQTLRKLTDTTFRMSMDQPYPQFNHPPALRPPLSKPRIVFQQPVFYLVTSAHQDILAYLYEIYWKYIGI